MIHDLTSTSMLQTCEMCALTRTIQVNELMVGQAGIDDHTAVEMPICECGAQETLNRTLANPGDHAYLVNSLHEHLVRLGRVHETSRERLATERTKPTHRGTLTAEVLTVPPQLTEAVNQG